MKAPEQRPSEGKLPLPSPRSPGDLDQRILAYARDNTPRSRPAMRPAWMAGIATACVLVVALLLGGPEQQARMDRMESETRKPESIDNASAPAAVTAKRAAGAEPEAAAPAFSARAANKLARDRDTPADREVTGAAAGAGLAEQDIPAALEESADMSSEPEPAMEPSWLEARIREIALQMESGERLAAQEAYRALQQQCPDCQLPETLEEALAAYRNY